MYLVLVQAGRKYRRRHERLEGCSCADDKEIDRPSDADPSSYSILVTLDRVSRIRSFYELERVFEPGHMYIIMTSGIAGIIADPSCRRQAMSPAATTARFAENPLVSVTKQTTVGSEGVPNLTGRFQKQPTSASP